MPAYTSQTVLSVRHWNDTLFSFTTTRDAAFRFRAGQCVLIGLAVNGKPLLRAYSMVSAPWEERLEFYSIKVPGGPLTSRLQHIREGDTVLVGQRPTGSLLMENLKPGRHLYLLATGTGLAPFLSLIKEPELYAKFGRIVLVHGARLVSDLGYRDSITQELPQHPYVGELLREQLLYYPTVTREPFVHEGRLTTLLENGRLGADLGLPPLAPEHDRVMICGSPAMLGDMLALLKARGFVEGTAPVPGDYVYERAFLEK